MYVKQAMKFLSCNGTSVSNLMFFSSAQTHILVRGCHNVHIDNVRIQSPGDSPNTDGIHIHASTQVIVTNSNIACGKNWFPTSRANLLVEKLTFDLVIMWC